MINKIAELKNLNAEGRRLLDEYLKLHKEYPHPIEITNKEKLYEELGEELGEKIENIQKKNNVEKVNEWVEKSNKMWDEMELLLSEINSSLRTMFDPWYSKIRWDSFQYILAPYAPNDFYYHPGLTLDFDTMVAVAEWKRVEKVLNFLFDWWEWKD